MLEELLAKLKAEIDDSAKEMQAVKKSFEVAKKEMNYVKPAKPKLVTKDAVMAQAPKFSMSKAERFKDKSGSKNCAGSEELGQSTLSVLSVTSAMDMVGKRQPAPVFTKSDRFKPSNQVDERDYQVNIDVVKKKPMGVIIKPQAESVQHSTSFKKRAKAKQLDNQSIATTSSRYDELETQASASQYSALGPGAYNINYNQVDKSLTVSIPKSQRFKQPEQAEGTAHLV